MIMKKHERIILNRLISFPLILFSESHIFYYPANYTFPILYLAEAIISETCSLLHTVSGVKRVRIILLKANLSSVLISFIISTKFFFAPACILRLQD